MAEFVSFIAMIPRLVSLLWELHLAIERAGGEAFLRKVEFATKKLKEANTEGEFFEAAEVWSQVLSNIKRNR